MSEYRIATIEQTSACVWTDFAWVAPWSLRILASIAVFLIAEFDQTWIKTVSKTVFAFKT